MGDTTISWCDKTWNPIRGCRRTAPDGAKQSGCGDPSGGGCYAERQAARFSGPGGAYEGLITLTANGPRWSGKTKFVAEHLADPIRWRKPRRIFVDSMSDLFYDGFENEQIAAVFGVMAACPQHTFQILTKRAKRMREWFEWIADQHYPTRGEPFDASNHARQVIQRAAMSVVATLPVIGAWSWPLPNVWLGVSVENQPAAIQRVPELLQTPAAVRFISAEPLLGPVDLAAASPNARSLIEDLDWIIVGCESGPGARPCDVAWIRSLRDQCAAARVPMFLKQAQETLYHCNYGFDPNPDGILEEIVTWGEGSTQKSRGPGGEHIIELPYLDGVQHAAFPVPS